MPSFRDRPLTWLFFFATACLDLVALATNHETKWADGLLLGQLFVVGVWLALGHSHRLARAGVAVAAVVLFVAPDYVIEIRKSVPVDSMVWPHVLGWILVAVAVSSAVSGALSMLGRLLFGPATEAPARRWQFPLAEIFGWMIVVAVTATLLQASRFDYFFQLARSSRELAWALSGAFSTGIVMAISHGNFSRASWPKGVLESAWLVLLMLAALASPPEEWITAFVSCLYAGVWTLTRKLDLARQASNEPKPVPLRLHDDGMSLEG
jgi:hypothetical protein